MAMDDKEFLKIFSPPTDEDRAAGLALLPQHVRDALPRTRQCDDNVGRVKLYAPWNDGAYAGWCWHVISVTTPMTMLRFATSKESQTNMVPFAWTESRLFAGQEVSGSFANPFLRCQGNQ